jgi:hypothetical protein
MIKMVIGLHVSYPLFLSDFIDTWIISIDFRKILKYQISRKNRPVGVKLFHVDGRTDGQTWRS